MTTYKRGNEFITKEEVTREQKLINLYNQVHGTSLTTESVGITTINVTSNIKQDNSYKYFAYMIRNGKPFKPDVVHAEEKREALRKR